jgi:hypothetical protein
LGVTGDIGRENHLVFIEGEMSKFPATRVDEAPTCEQHGVMVADTDLGRSWHCAVCPAIYPPAVDTTREAVELHCRAVNVDIKSKAMLRALLAEREALQLEFDALHGIPCLVIGAVPCGKCLRCITQQSEARDTALRAIVAEMREEADSNVYNIDLANDLASYADRLENL